MDSHQRAQLALSLRDNEAFQEALNHIRTSALEDLVEANPTDADAIRKHQATIQVVDALHGQIDGFIREGTPKRPPGVA